MKKKVTNCKIIFCFFLFFISQFGLTQLNAQKPAGKKDTAFVNNLLQQSTESLRKDSARSISLAIQAKELAEEIGFLRGEAYALKNIGLSYYYQEKYLETLDYWNRSLAIFKQLKDDIGIANLLNNIAAVYLNNGDNTNALEYSLQSLKLSERAGDTLRILSALNMVANIYFTKEPTMVKALDYFLKALPLSEKLGDIELTSIILANIGQTYFQIGDNANALIFLNKSIKVLGNSGDSPFAYNGLGKLYLRKGDFEQALKYHQKALAVAEEHEGKLGLVQSLEGIANVYRKKNESLSALNYFHKATEIAKELQAIHELQDLYGEMATTYSGMGDYHSAYKYQSLYSSIKDTIYNNETDKKLASLQFDFDLQKKQSEINLLAQDKILQEVQLKKQNYFRNGLLIGLALVLIIAITQWRHSNHRRKANLVLQTQKQETEQQKEKAEKTLEDLKTTQAQLIQSEKMASLGQLTSGIAHEIQNPLNFVNNFSEVNKELLVEMKNEMDKGNFAEAKSIATDVIGNEEKINHHGKRADAIVKGMLQHSQSNTGVKEPIDINALAGKYLRLAYHGLRTNDNTFHSTMVTDFDTSIGNVNIIPQDIGRVLLNLYNNAFYAVNEKLKQQLKEYEPTVLVSTKRINGKVEIKVKDNGNGIPQKVTDKIFQPFFTTKPTGQGTGLGLSLSYEIIKAHGGEVGVATNENEGAEFIIQLPIAALYF